MGGVGVITQPTVAKREVSLPLKGERSLATSRGLSILVYVGLTLFAISPHRTSFPMAAFSLLGFSLPLMNFPAIRPTKESPITPLNWTLLAFFLQLVVCPLLLCFFGPYQFVLPFLPSEFSINAAINAGRRMTL